MFEELSSGQPVYVLPGGYLDQDPRLDADKALARVMYEWAEKDMDKPNRWGVKK